MADEPKVPETDTKTDGTGEKKDGMRLWEKIGVWGLGTVLVLYMLPLVMRRGEKDSTFIQDKLITTLEKNIENQAALTKSVGDLVGNTKELTGKVDDLVDSQKALAGRIRPLTDQVERAATAVEEQAKQEAENDADQGKG